MISGGKRRPTQVRAGFWLLNFEKKIEINR